MLNYVHSWDRSKRYVWHMWVMMHFKFYSNPATLSFIPTHTHTWLNIKNILNEAFFCSIYIQTNFKCMIKMKYKITISYISRVSSSKNKYFSEWILTNKLYTYTLLFMMTDVLSLVFINTIITLRKLYKLLITKSFIIFKWERRLFDEKRHNNEKSLRSKSLISYTYLYPHFH